MLTPMAATEGEFLLISGNSHCLRSFANSSERWNDEQREIDRWNKRVSGREKVLQSKCKRKREWLSLSWWGDGEICRKKKGLAAEYETRKDRQRSENQFICSLVGWHWLRPAFLLWPHCQSSQTEVCTNVCTHTHIHTTHKHTHIYILDLSRARVRLSPNYSNYLSSKHSLPWLPPEIQRGRTANERGGGKIQQKQVEEVVLGASGREE